MILSPRGIQPLCGSLLIPGGFSTVEKRRLSIHSRSKKQQRTGNSMSTNPNEPACSFNRMPRRSLGGGGSPWRRIFCSLFLVAAVVAQVLLLLVLDERGVQARLHRDRGFGNSENHGFETRSFSQLARRCPSRLYLLCRCSHQLGSRMTRMFRMTKGECRMTNEWRTDPDRKTGDQESRAAVAACRRPRLLSA
jgi:hypothetical protein